VKRRRDHNDPIEDRIARRYVVDPDTGCWNWTGTVNGQGRGRITYEGRPQYAYRVTYRVLVGPIPDGLLICHHCDNPLCVNPEHLYAGTARDNMRDAMERGRWVPFPRNTGEDNWNSRPLTVAEQAVAAYLAGEGTQAELAARFGVTQSTIGRWVRRDGRGDLTHEPHVRGIGKKHPSRLKPCGTRAGYSRHIKNGEKPCEACAAENLRYMRDYKPAWRRARREAGLVAS
jgi:hypothetical protein